MQYVLGHKAPDTDAICSAIAWSSYLQSRGLEAEPVALGEANKETQYVLNHAGIPLPRQTTSLPDGSEIVLVDHTEAGQSIPQRENYQIVHVIDHHKVADFHTSAPLRMRLEPVGSTCTVIAQIWQEQDYLPTAPIAQIMIGAILSDTLYFRSPTCTDLDKQMVAWLDEIAQIDSLDQYAQEMFEAKSDLSHLSIKEIVLLDYKQFEFSGHKTGIGVMETTTPSYALDHKGEILQALDDIREEQGLNYILFCVIDIFEQQAVALVPAHETSLISEVFDVSVVDGTADLGDRVSRKKQIVPLLDQYFGQ